MSHDFAQKESQEEMGKVNKEINHVLSSDKSLCSQSLKPETESIDGSVARKLAPSYWIQIIQYTDAWYLKQLYSSTPAKAYLRVNGSLEPHNGKYLPIRYSYPRLSTLTPYAPLCIRHFHGGFQSPSICQSACLVIVVKHNYF